MGVSFHDARTRLRRKRRERRRDAGGLSSLRSPLSEAQGILGRRGGRSIDAKSGQDRALPASHSK